MEVKINVIKRISTKFYIRPILDMDRFLGYSYIMGSCEVFNEENPKQRDDAAADF